MSAGNHATILNTIHAADQLILAIHRYPDGDAVGSILALAHYLDHLSKTYTLFNQHPVGPYLSFLPKSYDIGPHHQAWKQPNIDVVVVLDCGDLNQAGITEQVQQLPTQTQIINIDHHATNQQFGHHNLVVPQASSTCELVFELLDSMRAIDKTIATCLLTGIITDTGSFSNLATSAKALAVAARLVALGANLPKISRLALEHRPYATLKLWGRALERLYEDPVTHMIITVLTLEDMQELGADTEAAAGISNFLNSLEQAANKAVLVLTQTEPGLIKGSFRTTNPLLDVSEFAKLQGGGGHKKAAGFTLKGTLIYHPNGYTIIPPSH